MAINIQLRRGTASEWTTANPTLAVAEIGIEIDTGQFKVGTGSATWTALDYGGIVGPEGPVSTVPGPQGETGATGPQGEEKFSGFLLMGS